jgi:ribosomal protein S18 acetylase RimI-like enzyme
MIIRTAELKDLKAIEIMFKEMMNDIPYYNELAKTNEINHYTVENLKRKISIDEFSVIVATDNEKIIGFCFNRFDDYTIWLEWIITDTNYRKSGIGQQILEKLQAYSKIRNCHKIWCDCRTSNAISKSFLEKFGFKLIVELKRHWYQQDFYLFEKEIQQ